MSARRATPEARPVWFTLDELVNLPGIELRALAQHRFHAAPADPAEALRGLISTAMLCVMPDPVAAFAAAETVTDAVLVALGWKASA